MGKVVFTNGCFDVIHPGHLSLLTKCRELAGIDGRVIVGVNSDESVRRLKGPSRPFFSSDHRVFLLQSLRQVDEVILFEEDTPIKLIERIRPDLIVKGGDYAASEVVGASLAEVTIVPLSEGYSSTGVIEKL